MELKDVLGYLDVKEADITVDGKLSIDKFKEAFNGDKGFFRKDQLEQIVKGDADLVNKLTGSRVGAIEAQLTRNMKSMGVELDDETSKAGIEKKMEFIYKTYSTKTKEELKSVKDELATKDVDAATKEWRDKYHKIEAKYNDTDGLLKKTALDLESEKKGRIDFEKSITIKSIHNDALSKIKFSKSVDDLKKKGFLSTLQESYKLDIDETGAVFPMTLDGKRIENKVVNGKFYTVDELYQQEAEKNNLIEKEQSKKFGSNIVQSTSQNVESGEPKRKTFREL